MVCYWLITPTKMATLGREGPEEQGNMDRQTEGLGQSAVRHLLIKTEQKASEYRRVSANRNTTTAATTAFISVSKRPVICRALRRWCH